MSKKNPEQPDRSQDAVDTAVQPVATPSAGPSPTDRPADVPAQPNAAAAAATPVPPEPAATIPPRSRFAWVSSPKVAAATVITVLALGSLGGAFALGRATAGPDEHDRILIRAGFDGQERFGGGPQFGGPQFGGPQFGGPGMQAPDQAPAAPQQDDQDDQGGSGSDAG